MPASTLTTSPGDPTTTTDGGTSSTATDASIDDGVHYAFIVEIDRDAQTLTFDQFDPLVADEEAWVATMTIDNVNQRTRRVPISDDVSVQGLCQSAQAMEPIICRDGQDGLEDVASVVYRHSYSWGAARTNDLGTGPFPPAFRLDIEAENLVRLTQLTTGTAERIGWSIDQKGWPSLAVPACCASLNVGPVSAELPAALSATPASTLYNVEYDSAAWSPDRPDQLEISIARWVPGGCSGEDPCPPDAVTVSPAGRAAYTVQLTDDVVVHIFGFQCGAGGPGGTTYVGNGSALASLLARFEGAVEEWIRASVRAGASVDEALTLLSGSTGDSPFRVPACPDGGYGAATYVDGADIGILVQGFGGPGIDGLRTAAQLLGVTALATDSDGRIHLYAYAGFLP